MALALELVTSFGLGVAANVNPCVIPLYPGFLSYLSNKADVADKQRFVRVSGLLVLAGVLAFMVVVGAVTAGFDFSISRFVSTVSPIAFGVLLLLGVLLIFNVDFGRLIPRLPTPALDNPYSSAFIYGLFYGPIVIPCNAPLVFAVFAFSVGVGGFLSKFLVFLAFGLGLGVPLFLLSLTSAAKGSWLIRKFNTYRRSVNLVAGAALIGLSIYELVVVFRVLG